MRSFLLIPLLFLLVQPLRALEPEALIARLNRQGNLEPLFAALDTRALAHAAELDREVTSLLARLKPRLRGGKVVGAAHATEAAGVTLRLDLAGRQLNYLSLLTDDRGRLADWYDYALGVRLAELVRALVEQGDAARDYLQMLERDPVRALGSLPDSRDGRILSRLALAACGGRDCYTTALARMQTLDPVHASLWRYERAVQNRDEDAAARALNDLRGELGRDPGLAWLNYARALARGNCAAVRSSLEAALQRWPDYRRLYPVAAQCAARTRDWTATTHWLRAMEQRFGRRIDTKALRNHPVYGDYVKSKSFRNWRGEEQ